MTMTLDEIIENFHRTLPIAINKVVEMTKNQDSRLYVDLFVEKKNGECWTTDLEPPEPAELYCSPDDEHWGIIGLFGWQEKDNNFNAVKEQYIKDIDYLLDEVIEVISKY